MFIRGVFEKKKQFYKHLQVLFKEMRQYKVSQLPVSILVRFLMCFKLQKAVRVQKQFEVRKMLQYQLMEYRAINSLHLTDSPISEGLINFAYQTSNPHLNLHLNNLYYLISNLFQQQNRSKQELQMLRKEVEAIKCSDNFQHMLNFQSESNQLKKEDAGQLPIKQKKKLPKQFKCELPFCTRKYGSLTALRAHMRKKHLSNDDNLDFVPL